MTFLNPALLWGLLALAVPIIVHFFNLQRPREVLFSNVELVKAVQNTVVRRVKFQRWLLLLLRLLAVAAIVLAFANPVIVAPGNAQLQGNRSVVIVLDNSYSMTAGNEKGQYFQQGVSLARNLIRAYDRQDEFLVMGLDDLKLRYNFSGPEEALEALREIKVEQSIRSHEEVLAFREDLFARANNRVKEIYLLSDFQRSTIMADSQSLALDDSSVLIKYLPLATRDQNNAYPEAHQIRSQILEKNKPVELSMDLVNDGTQSLNNLNVRVIVEGKAAAIDNTDLPPNGVSKLDLTFTPTQSGWLAGYIEIDDNPVDFDNRRYFSLYVPEKEKILVVEDQASPNLRILFENLFAGQFDASFVSFRQLSTLQLNDYRSIIMVGVKQLSSGLSDRLSTFVIEGGSMMLIPGDEADLNSLDAFTQAVGLGRFLPVESLSEGKLAEGVDLQHPIFEGVFTRNQSRRSFDAPRVYQYHPLQLNNQSIHNRIVTVDNQAPILLESQLGEGMMFTFTLFPGDAWTDFHVKSVFTPLMFRATQIMNQTQNVEQGQEIGFFQPKRIRTNQQTLITLVRQDGQITTPEQYSQGGATTLSFEKMDLLEGNYQIQQEGQLLEKISFNISDLESRLAYLNRADLSNELTAKGYRSIQVLEATPESLSTRIQTEKTGTPLWKYFIVIALLMLLAEIALLKFGEKPEAKSVKVA